ncbi:YjgN family protein [Chelativorans salis]|uniref:YjgN family protein n=1 Tax=Chelativorans salis TaxID=2978478 RepID=A0ABT2LIZ5_9HYPH|nr:YjgN family protein [Chelativorans sp. EGI FJ00035]MCT7373797.1 YjgN family protein [Chelativorans sp. EGI FJ00035]
MNDASRVIPAGGNPQDRHTETFSFTGRAGEYFGIWIVNILLTIVTLGIYSAWAKVRRQRYFYGNTELAGRSFDYHARGLQILIGRIVVLVALIIYAVLPYIFAYANMFVIYTVANLILPFLLLAAMPWLIKRGLRFNARVTSYRNVRLDFHGGYWGAFVAYLIGPFLATLTLGILAPLASRWMWRYTLGNVSYGGRKVACEPQLKALYSQWWMPALLVLLGVAPLTVLGLGLFGWASSGLATVNENTVTTAVFLVFLALMAIYGFAGLFYRAGVRNVAFNAAVFDGRHEFASRLGRRRYTWIAISNFLATIFSLGFARPWAAVRMARYVASATAVTVSGSLDDYLNEVEQTGPAIGAEYMDMEGFDFGL